MWSNKCSVFTFLLYYSWWFSGWVRLIKCLVCACVIGLTKTTQCHQLTKWSCKILYNNVRLEEEIEMFKSLYVMLNLIKILKITRGISWILKHQWIHFSFFVKQLREGNYLWASCHVILPCQKALHLIETTQPRTADTLPECLLN